MDPIAVSVALQLVATVIFTFMAVIVWRFVHILFQIEKDRFYEVRKTALMQDHLWAALESLGLSHRVRERALEQVERELDIMFSESNIQKDEADSPGAPREGDRASKKSPAAR